MTTSLTDRSVMITGGTGYIGSRLARSLAPRTRTSVLVRDPQAATELFADTDVTVHSVGDRRTLEVVEAARPHVIFHLATRYERNDPDDVTEMVRANLEFGVEILDVASRLDDCRVVLVGSHFQVPAPGRQPSNLYAATKEALLVVARYFAGSRGLRWTQAVLYDVYGPDDPRDKLIPRVVASLSAGNPIRVPDPEPQHHFVYVDDVVEGLIAAAAGLASGHVDVGESVFLTSLGLATPTDVVAAAGEVLSVVPVFDETPYVPPAHTIMVPTDGPRPHGWEPTVSLSEGIRRTIGSAP